MSELQTMLINDLIFKLLFDWWVSRHIFVLCMMTPYKARHSTNGRTQQAVARDRDMIYWVQGECTVKQRERELLMDSLRKTNNWEPFSSSSWMDWGLVAPTRWAVRTLTSLVVYKALVESSSFIFTVFVFRGVGAMWWVISFCQIYLVP